MKLIALNADPLRCKSMRPTPLRLIVFSNFCFWKNRYQILPSSHLFGDPRPSFSTWSETHHASQGATATTSCGQISACGFAMHVRASNTIAVLRTMRGVSLSISLSLSLSLCLCCEQCAGSPPFFLRVAHFPPRKQRGCSIQRHI